MKVTAEIADRFNMSFGSDPYWNESSWFSWGIPEKGVNGLFYHFFRPNMNCLNGGPAMWDGSGVHTWDCLYWDWQYMRQLPEGRFGVDYNKYDYEAPCSMSVRTLEPLKRYHLGYDRGGFKLDLTFEAIAEPHALHDHEAGKLNTAYRFHFEQPGRVRGKVVLRGETYHVDCFSIRDGSHGHRFWGDVPPGGYTWSTADERNGWHFIAVDAADSRETRLIGGYLLRDGEMATLTGGVRRVTERIASWPSFIEVEAEDSLGRKLHASGRLTVPGEFHYYSDQVQTWGQFAWSYDGFKDVIGEDQEYYNTVDMRAWKRAGPDRWRTR
jgi:hypothetical protein